MINLSYVTNTTPVARLYSAGALVGGDIAMAEIGSTGEYQTQVPAGTPAGEYLVVFFDGAAKIASGPLFWDGVSEVDQALASIVLPGYTLQDCVRISSAVLAGRVSGVGTETEVFDGMDGEAAVVTTKVDAEGNRLSVDISPGA